MKRLPIKNTIIGTYLYLWQERQALWRLILPPIIILGLLNAIAKWRLFSSVKIENSSTYIDLQGSGWLVPLLMLILFLNAWIWSSFSIAWHRGYLLSGYKSNVLDVYKWNGYQIKYLWTMIKILFLMIPALFLLPYLAVLPFSPSLLAIFCLMIYGYIYVRLFLWLPAIAIEKHLNIQALWSLSKNNGWRLLFIITTILAPLVIISFFFILVTGKLGFAIAVSKYLSFSLISNLFFEFLSFMILAASVSALSISFNFFVQNNINYSESS